MVHYSNYYISKDKVLNEVRTALQSLDYEIDMYAPETYALSTKPVKIKGEASKYNYTLFVKISDRIEIYISAKIIIYKRNSQSNFGKKNVGRRLKIFETKEYVQIIQKNEDKMHRSVQKKIFKPIHKELNKIKRKNKISFY